MQKSPSGVSIVIPFFNEEAVAYQVLAEMRAHNPEAEIIAVNDGSTDNTHQSISSHKDVRLISFPKNLGQSAALYAGIKAAKNEICVLADGDGQHDPADIAKLVELLKTTGSDCVCGFRENRQDSIQRKVAGRIGNAVRVIILGNDGSRDTTCTLKAFRTEHARHLVPFNGMHRYIPALFRRSGLTIVEIPVNHRPRKGGISKYGIADRAWRGVFDLIGMKWILKRSISWPENIHI